MSTLTRAEQRVVNRARLEANEWLRHNIEIHGLDPDIYGHPFDVIDLTLDGPLDVIDLTLDTSDEETDDDWEIQMPPPLEHYPRRYPRVEDDHNVEFFDSLYQGLY